MSSFSIAKAKAAAAFSKEKPRSSITEWVDILTSSSYDDEVYDGIPELIHSIDLQASGPTEASRAVRKKIKHGNAHQQYRALVILNALVENCGQKFHSSFADGHLTDALKHLATDSTTDPKVRKKVLAVLASWSRQFKDDRSAPIVAGLYRQVKPADQSRKSDPTGRRWQRSANVRASRGEERRKRPSGRNVSEPKRLEVRRPPPKLPRLETVQFRTGLLSPHPGVSCTLVVRWLISCQEKPQVLTAIANASSAANNLINAITLVHTESDSLLTNERVQECLARVKQSRKVIVRYTQLVEDEEIIGTLIDTNERIISALESYDKLSNPNVTEKDVEEVQQGLEAAHITGSEVQKLQEKQRAAVQRAVRQRPSSRADDYDAPESPIHPDLQDLSFGTLGPEKRYACLTVLVPTAPSVNRCNRHLQPPIRPTTPPDEDRGYSRGSLSDFSDYESSDGETYRDAGESSSRSQTRRTYIDVSDNEEEDEDPFADPFAD
ncbi:hypothetical protein BC826DRAFT_1185098 [Russula brevipes]|nr:hypothetical protein BC826DRAFT_1185098 [Russula brevipes]